jgi:hypothetical protein
MKSKLIGILVSMVLVAGIDARAGFVASNVVPPEVLAQFEGTFMYDDEGIFVGAEISMLMPYLNDEEIIVLVSSYAGLPKCNIFIHYKWKRRGGGSCVYDPDWICVLIGEISGELVE